MRWPDDSGLPEEIIKRLNCRIAQFLEEDQSPTGGKDSQAAKSLILDLFSIIQPKRLTVNDEGMTNLILKGQVWDTDEPHLAHVQKYINRLFADRHDDAHAYLDRAINEKLCSDLAVAAEARFKDGASGGKKKHENSSKAIEEAQRYYAKNHGDFASKKDAARFCEQKFPPVKYSTYLRILRKIER